MSLAFVRHQGGDVADDRRVVRQPQFGVQIGGRAFLTSADYRALAERFRIGDLQDLLSSEIFKNVIFASREDLEDLSRRLDDAVKEFRTDGGKARIDRAGKTVTPMDEKPGGSQPAAGAEAAKTVAESSGVIFERKSAGTRAHVKVA